MDNKTIAQKLGDYAAKLARTKENQYRVQAYRQAVVVVEALARPLEDLMAEKGRAGLEALPGIGPGLAYTIEGLLRTGEFRTWRGKNSTGS